jgi:hypothetical protein
MIRDKIMRKQNGMNQMMSKIKMRIRITFKKERLMNKMKLMVILSLMISRIIISIRMFKILNFIIIRKSSKSKMLLK